MSKAFCFVVFCSWKLGKGATDVGGCYVCVCLLNKLLSDQLCLLRIISKCHYHSKFYTGDILHFLTPFNTQTHCRLQNVEYKKSDNPRYRLSLSSCVSSGFLVFLSQWIYLPSSRKLYLSGQKLKIKQSRKRNQRLQGPWGVNQHSSTFSFIMIFRERQLFCDG